MQLYLVLLDNMDAHQSTAQRVHDQVDKVELPAYGAASVVAFVLTPHDVDCVVSDELFLLNLLLVVYIVR